MSNGLLSKTLQFFKLKFYLVEKPNIYEKFKQQKCFLKILFSINKIRLKKFSADVFWSDQKPTFFYSFVSRKICFIFTVFFFIQRTESKIEFNLKRLEKNYVIFSKQDQNSYRMRTTHFPSLV